MLRDERGQPVWFGCTGTGPAGGVTGPTAARTAVSSARVVSVTARVPAATVNEVVTQLVGDIGVPLGTPVAILT